MAPPPPPQKKKDRLPEALIIVALLVLLISGVAYLVTLEPAPPSAEGPCREMLIPGRASKATVCPHVDHVAEPVAGEPPAIFCRCWAEGDPVVER